MNWLDPLELPPSTILRRFAMGCVFMGGAVFHIVALIRPEISIPEPPHQHLLFVVLNLAVMFLLNTERVLIRATNDPRLELLKPALAGMTVVLWTLALGMFAHDLVFHGPLLVASFDTRELSRIDRQSFFALLWGALVVAILATERRDV